MKKEIYLDNAATTKVLPEVTKAVVEALEQSYANPSSLHSFGLKSENILEQSRKKIAAYLGVNPKEIIFSSGGTESNNLAIRGITQSYQNRGKHLISSPIEHASVANLFQNLAQAGWQIDQVKVDKKGKVDLQHLKSLITDQTVLVSIMHVNNELGTIQPVKKIAELIKKINPLTFFHVDGVQAFGKVYSDLKNWQIDLYSISGHKVHAPMGVGALYCQNGINLTPLVAGGSQEKGLRPGTENIPAIAGFKVAVDNLAQLSPKSQVKQSLIEKNNYLRQRLKEIKAIVLNSPQTGAPHIINFSLPGIKGETMLHALANQGIYLSTGSACSSKKPGNRILNACGLEPKISESALRVSLERKTTKTELDFFLKILKEQIDFLKIL